MSRALAMLAALSLAACNSNTDAGADREADLAPDPEAAVRMSASDALSGIAVEAVQPEVISDADLASLGAEAGNCAIRLTEVAKPSLVYEQGLRATIKLNGKLITVPSSGAGQYGDAGLTITLRPLDEMGNAGLPAEQMVLMLPGAKDELGFNGYRDCDRG